MIKSVFDSFTPDKEASVSHALTNGNGFLIFAINSLGTGRILIGVVLFSADEHGIWIYWLVVASKKFDSTRFGKQSSKETFRNSGFGTLLLLLAQLRSKNNGWSTSIYLQANQGETAVCFYKAIGFQKCQTNSIESIPM